MKLKIIRLKNFKRFDDLTINLGDTPKKIIALVGPNGCGKSSVFDAFEEILKDYKGASQNEHASYFSKLCYSILPDKKAENYNKNESITITKEDGTNSFDKKSFYIRSAYRFTAKLKVDSIKAQPGIIEDYNRPYSSNAIDSRMQSNYERLLSKLLNEFEQGNKTGAELKKEFLEKINKILQNILDVKVSSLGNVGDDKGNISFDSAFCFAKYSLKFRRKKESSPRGRSGRGVWGEFRHARAKSNCGQPRLLLVQSRILHKSFVFLLEEQNRYAQIKKCEENFFAGGEVSERRWGWLPY